MIFVSLKKTGDFPSKGFKPPYTNRATNPIGAEKNGAAAKTTLSEKSLAVSLDPGQLTLGLTLRPRHIQRQVLDHIFLAAHSAAPAEFHQNIA